jgi:flagellar basal body rod protein FlgG
LASQIDPNSLARSSVPAALDMRAGNLRASANVLDVVVEGEGFFEVSTAQGPAFMRQASLRADPGGRLLTQQGHAIAGLRADVRPGAGDISFSPQGEVRQGERSIGQIRLLRFNQANLLQSLGHGLFAQGGASIADGHPGNLRSGFQEASNVNSAQEMVQLTETVRHFESMQKAMQGYGEVYAQTLRKLGEF